MEYYFLFFIIAVLALYEYSHPKAKMNKTFWVMSIVLVVFAGTRKDIGTDYNIYTHVFGLSKESIELALIETEAYFVLPAHYLDNIHYVFFLYAIPSVLIICNEINKEKYKFLVLLLFYSFTYLFYDMGIMRQGLALSICIFSLRYIKRKKPGIFIIIILSSTLIIHRTCFVFFPMYWIANINFTRKKFYILLVLSLIFGITFHVRWVAEILSFLPNIFQKAINTITDTSYSDSSFGLTECRKIVLSIFFFELLYNKHISSREKIFLNMYLVGVFLSLLLINHLTMKSRGTYYYCISEIFIIPLCITYIRMKTYRNLFISVFVLYGLLYVKNIIREQEYYEWQNLPYEPYNSIIYNAN